MVDLIVAGIIVVMVTLAVRYIVKEKKKGVKCIGCPMAGTCGQAKAGGCTCHTISPE